MPPRFLGSFRLRPFAALLLGALLPAISTRSLAEAPTTQRHYLSGVGPDQTVPWDFTVSAGRRAGETTTIRVPSQWEQEGFGTYNYGQETHKSDEHGYYGTSFEIPAAWSGQRIRLVFGAVMTDATVTVNGEPAGPTHQGGFTQFSYDITRLVKPGQTNRLEVDVAKVSTNAATELVERGGDYWVFGGIYRPVWLEASPAHGLGQIAIDARADGALTVDVTLSDLHDRRNRPDGPTLVSESLEAQVFDAEHRRVGEPFKASIPAGGGGRLRLTQHLTGIQPWTAETPHLYTVEVTRRRGPEALHAVTTRFGFRTFEIRPGDGLYLNGQRILLKGVNRHSFRPATGRALSREDCYDDVRLIRSLNMNAVRMSHYPPDPAFLEACDELGLYVLDELSGWQQAHDTPNGRLLVRELIERDVNHPSIIIWDNGNEGGWNRDLDADFSLYDPQQRPVLHPWDPFGGVDTKHYTDFAEHQRRLDGPNLVMPTEILHALYDGGAGAGLADYWNAIVASPVGAGAFIWDLADEGISRSDQAGRIDNFSTFAPDGIVGPNHEKEGSYYTVRDLWSPIQMASPRLDERFTGALPVQNLYDFTSLDQCHFAWSWVRFENDQRQTLAHGKIPGPVVPPHQRGTLQLPLPDGWADSDALELTALAPNGENLWTWTWPTPALDRRVSIPAGNTPQSPTTPRIEKSPDTVRLSVGKTTATFDAATGTLQELQHGENVYALSNGPRLTFARPADEKTVTWLSWSDDNAAHGIHELATPQAASLIELEIDSPRDVPYRSARIELSPDGGQWHPIFAGSRRPGDGARFAFPPQPVKAVRITNLRQADGSPARIKSLKIGYEPARFPASDASHATISSGRDDQLRSTWIESRGANGLDQFRWTLSADGSLRLDYRYHLAGEFLYHGITFDHPETAFEAMRWLGEGPYRVWKNRLRGTWLGLHQTKRQTVPEEATPSYPEFEGFFAGIRWAKLATTAGPLTLLPGSPSTYLRIGTPLVNHPQTTVDFPAGNLSVLHAIPGMGSKFKSPAVSGPSAQPTAASGTYTGSLLFRFEP